MLLRRILAALVLLPASFAALRGAWLATWGMLLRRFFTCVIREGSRPHRARSLLSRFCLRRLLPLGRDLVRKADSPLTWRLLRRSSLDEFIPIPLSHSSARRASRPPASPLPASAAAAAVAAPGIRAVGLDLFGLLISHPVLEHPRDLRLLAEALIRCRRGRPGDGAESPADAAIRCLRETARPRPEGVEILRAAKAAGRRVVAAADAFLPEDAARAILDARGLSGVDALHFSDAGPAASLPEDILRGEGILPEELLLVRRHPADVAEAMRLGIPALRLRTAQELPEGTVPATTIPEQARRDPLWGIAMGHVLDAGSAPAGSILSPEEFGRLVLGPLLAILALRIRRTALDLGADRVIFAEGCGDSPILRAFGILRERIGGPEGVIPPAEPGEGGACARKGEPVLVIDAADSADARPEELSCHLRLADAAGRPTGRILPLMETDGDPIRPWRLLTAELLASPAGAAARDLPPESPEACGDRIRILAAALETVRGLAERLGAWTEGLAGANPWSSVALFRRIVMENPIQLEIFRRIGRACPAGGRFLSLERALANGLEWWGCFAGTGFEDIRNVLPAEEPAPQQPPPALNAGIHIHLHNPALAQEFLERLRGFPASFDLFVTASSERAAGLLERLFTPAILPAARRIRVLAVPNRGRDIAPWVVDLAEEQGRFDLFCHAHGKESPHLPFGADWRRHLLDNVLHPEAVRRILRAFAADPRLGCLFPAMHPGFGFYLRGRGTTEIGLDADCLMAERLLERMGLPGCVARREILFSAGSMFWYRPKALAPIFSCGLRREDFPGEPIGVSGTLAHALERIPALVALRTGHISRTLTPWPGEAEPFPDDPA